MLCNIRFHYKSKFSILPVNPFVPLITIALSKKHFSSKYELVQKGKLKNNFIDPFHVSRAYKIMQAAPCKTSLTNIGVPGDEREGR